MHNQADLPQEKTFRLKGITLESSFDSASQLSRLLTTLRNQLIDMGVNAQAWTNRRLRFRDGEIGLKVAARRSQGIGERT